MDDAELDLWQRRPGTEPRLAEIYWPIVWQLARKWEAKLSRRWRANKLAGFGAIGLMQAVKSFDLSRGIKPGTAITPRIIGAMLDGVRGDQMKRPCDVRAKRQFTVCTNAGRAPDRPGGCDEEDWHDVKAFGWLAAPDDGDDDPTGMADFLMAKFPGRDVYVVARVYLMGAKMRDVGIEIGVSESRVSQLAKTGIERLRRHAPQLLRAMGRDSEAFQREIQGQV